MHEPGQRVHEAACIVAEDVHTPVLMPAGSETPVIAQSDAQAEAAFRLVLAYPRESLCLVQTPHVDLAADAAARQVLAICTEGNRPDIAGLVLVYDLAVEHPLGVRVLTPDLDFALETGTCGAARGGFFGGYEVVDAKRVRFVKGLHERKVGLCCVVDVYRGGAGRGEELGGCRGDGEDVGCFGVRIVDRVEGEVLLRLWV